MQKKKFNIVFTVMVIILLLVLLTDLLAFYYTTRSGLFKKINYSRLYFGLLFWPSVFIIEVIIFWVRRNHIQVNLLIVLYLMCIAITIVSMQYIIMMLNYIGLAITDITRRNSFFKTVKILHAAVFWILTIIGHAFFITTIAKSFKRKEAEDNEQATGIFDGIIDEY